MGTTCVLIPSYNEARSIGGIVRELKAKGVTVFVVDDGSTDDTASIAGAQGAVVVKHDVNKGKGASLQEGFKHILKKDFDAVLVMDGDGQHRVSDVDVFLNKMEETGADVIIGNRMMDISAMPLIRIYTNRFMSNLISMICGQMIPDSQCGFRLIKRGVLEKIRLTSSNYEIESELIIEAAKKGFKVGSAPIMTVYENEKSRINPLVDTFRFVFFLVKLALRN
ncbi:MAG: glycosyltransferase family 2 protein [Candidatus Omnitrophica bacterium]|nr:glycosyltransferase family 2 protein [Candidatus Omnitrophota bacterium]